MQVVRAGMLATLTGTYQTYMDPQNAQQTDIPKETPKNM